MADWSSSRLGAPAVCMLLTLIKEIAGGDYCWTDSGGRDYCKYGCCSSNKPYYYCCGLNVALIVGAVVGGFVLICVVIAVVCCVLKKQGYRGRVVVPHSTGAANNVTVVHTNTTTMGYPTAPQPPQMGYLPPPGPVHGQAVPQPPPPYIYTNPAHFHGAGPQGHAFAAPIPPGYPPAAP